jgi:hypothetical protein
LQPSATEEEPDKLYFTRTQYMYVLSPARTVVAYRKVDESAEPPPQPREPPLAVRAIFNAGRSGAGRNGAA